MNAPILYKEVTYRSISIAEFRGEFLTTIKLLFFLKTKSDKRVLYNYCINLFFIEFIFDKEIPLFIFDVATQFTLLFLISKTHYIQRKIKIFDRNTLCENIESQRSIL